MQLLDFFVALHRKNISLTYHDMHSGTDIDGYELEETILSQHRYDDLEASFRVGINQRQAPCVSLDQQFRSVVERARRMFVQ